MKYLSPDLTPFFASVRAPRWELTGLAMLVLLYSCGDAYGPDYLDVFNIVGPAMLMAILGLSALRMILRDSNSVWSALVWFRISTVVYYGGGALFSIFADQQNRDYLLAFFAFDSFDEAKLNLIVAVGCLTALLAANMCLPVLSAPEMLRSFDGSPSKDRGRGLFITGMAFLLVGGTIKYLFVVPQMFGLTGFVVPGAIGTIGNFSSAAVYLLTVWSREYRRGAFPLVLVLVLVQVLIGILALTKAEVIITLILFLFAFLQPKVTPLRLISVVGALAASYLIIIPIIDVGRFEVQLRHGELGGADLAERAEIIRQVPATIGELTQNDVVTRALVRITYVNQSAFAVREYDSGRPGKTLSNALAVFVPRVLWPDKPITTAGAVDFNVAATGNPFSASSPGLFAESYWDGGWMGVVLLMFPLGILLAFLSRLTLDVLHNGKWLYFPVVLLAMQVSLRTDGYFVPDILGGFVIVMAAYILLWLVGPLLGISMVGRATVQA